VSFKRTRPYSRIQAITDTEEYDSVKDILEGKYKIADITVEKYVKNIPLENNKIRIFRGGSEIRPGDWVALEYDYAEEHGTPVYTMLVPTKDVLWAGTYKKEFYYVPEEIQGRFTLKRLWSEATKSKTFTTYKSKEFNLINNILPAIGIVLLFSPIFAYTGAYVISYFS